MRNIHGLPLSPVGMAKPTTISAARRTAADDVDEYAVSADEAAEHDDGIDEHDIRSLTGVRGEAEAVCYGGKCLAAKTVRR